MRRWDLIDPATDIRELATRMYRPDLYREAAASLGVSAPVEDWKSEGAHDAPWTLAAAREPIAMPPDRFSDGKIFVPDDVPASDPAAAKSALHKL
jgi:two-component system, oxyanion-binding sensor